MWVLGHLQTHLYSTAQLHVFTVLLISRVSSLGAAELGCFGSEPLRRLVRMQQCSRPAHAAGKLVQLGRHPLYIPPRAPPQVHSAHVAWQLAACPRMTASRGNTAEVATSRRTQFPKPYTIGGLCSVG